MIETISIECNPFFMMKDGKTQIECVTDKQKCPKSYCKGEVTIYCFR